jgi:hypothetical protein
MLSLHLPGGCRLEIRVFFQNAEIGSTYTQRPTGRVHLSYSSGIKGPGREFYRSTTVVLWVRMTGSIPPFHLTD